MNCVVATPWDRLTSFDQEQQSYLQTCLGRESDPVIPFGGPVTALRADPGGVHEIAADAVRIAYVAADGDEHLEMTLGRGDLLSLGIGPWIHRIASIETLAELLAEMLRPSMRRASAISRRELKLRVQRLADDPPLPRYPWPLFIAEGVRYLGRLKFKMSYALIAACKAHLMPRRGPDAIHHLPMIWDVRLNSVLPAPHEWRQFARGDVVRELLSPLPKAEIVGALVPHCEKSLMPGAALGFRRRVKMLIDAGGWISLKFGPRTLVGDTMEDLGTIDALNVPVTLTLPVVEMSLREIDGVEPGTLVDSGVHLQDVEVALWTAGRRFASARLVVIGDCLGVEIVRTERELP